MSDKKVNNVIDMTERIPENDQKARLKGMKVRFDLEQAKVAVSASLLSIVVLVTLANNNLMASSDDESPALQSMTQSSRGIASVGHETAMPVQDSSKVIEELSKRELSSAASLGRAPSLVEKLAFETLEGRYAVRLENGKIKEIEFSDRHSGSGTEQAKKIQNLAGFLESQKALLPSFDRSMKLGTEEGVEEKVETFQLVNGVSMPVAKVQFHMGSDGQLLAMHVVPSQLNSK